MGTERGNSNSITENASSEMAGRENWRHQPWELKQMQSLPLSAKKRMTNDRIKGWYEAFGDDVYLSYSGGKDSTVLLELVAKFCKEYGYKLWVVFCDTGLEYPEIRKFAEQNARRIADKYGIEMVFVRLKPDMIFRDVIIEYGYPIISKEVSKIIYGARHSKTAKQSYINKLKGLNPDGTYSDYKQRYKKYEILLQAPFEISSHCCIKMKENPAIRFENETGKKPITAMMAGESKYRLKGWLKTGCNAFDSKRPMSKPISFWTEQDVLEMILQDNIQIASVYGKVVKDSKKMGQADGQMCFDDFGIETQDAPLKTTGCSRTGCVFCGYGCHLDGEPTRFQRLKITHPRLYEYCIGGGQFNERGMWQPSKTGLGMGFVFDWLNEKFGDGFIEYK